MKEKIFKLLNTYTGPDFRVGRELFLAQYKDFILERGVKYTLGPNGNSIVLSLDSIEELLGYKFNRGVDGKWQGIYWSEKDLI